jgi:hypothetical protein
VLGTDHIWRGGEEVDGAPKYKASRWWSRHSEDDTHCRTRSKRVPSGPVDREPGLSRGCQLGCVVLSG